MATKRKPYSRPLTAIWWQKTKAYKMYMLREFTAIPALWFSLVLLYGVISPESFLSFLKNPIVFMLNCVALVAAVFHSKSWLELTPKAVNLVYKDKKIATDLLKKAAWGSAFVVSFVVLVIALF